MTCPSNPVARAAGITRLRAYRLRAETNQRIFYDGSEHQLIKLDPDDVLTTARAAELLEPRIKALPEFDDSMLPS